MSKYLINVSEYSPKPNVTQWSIYFVVSANAFGDLSLPQSLSSWCGDILISSSSLVGVSFASIFFTWFSTKDIGWLCLKTHAFSSVPLLCTHEKHHSLSQFLNVIYSQFIISANRSKQMVQVIFNFDLLHMNNGHTPFTPTATNVYLCHATDRQSDRERKRERQRKR